MYLTNIEYGKKYEKPILHLFGREEENGHRKRIDVTSYKPSFLSTEVNRAVKKGSINIEEITMDTLKERNKDMYKVTVEKVTDIRKLKTKVEETYNDDISKHKSFYPKRFLVDNEILTGVKKENGEIKATNENLNPRVCFLDIEVEASFKSFPDPMEAEEEVTVIGFYDSYQEKYFIFTTADIDNNKDRYELIKKNNEEELLKSFRKVFCHLDFDIISGWNIGGFDITYLIKRMEKLDISYKQLSPLRKVYFERDYPVIGGRTIFELRNAYINLKGSDLPSYALDEVAKQELDDANPIVIRNFAKVWNNNPEKMIEHNYEDIKHLVRLNEEKSIIKHHKEMSDLVGCTISDTIYNSRLVDMVILREARDRNLALKSGSNNKRKSYEGGAVFEPVIGIHKNLAVLDFASSYPSIIESFNISPETKYNYKYNDSCVKLDDKLFFRTDIEGIIPKLSKRLRKRRSKVKTKMKNASKGDKKKNYFNRQRAIKAIINSLYGVMGFTSFRLYDYQIARIITKIGREVLIAVKEGLEEMGIPVIYGDTDSVFIQLEEGNAVEGKKIEDVATDLINEYVKDNWGVSNHGIVLELEKIYDSCIIIHKRGSKDIPAKKKYHAKIKWDSGKATSEFDIKGLACGPRTTASDFTSKLQGKICHMMHNREKYKNIVNYVGNAIRVFRTGNLDLEEVGVPTKIKKNPTEYDNTRMRFKGWKNSINYLNLKFGKGDKPLRAYFKGIGALFYRDDDDFSTEIKNKLDIQMMVNRTVRGKVKPVLDLYEIDWEEVCPVQYNNIHNYS